jgi:hypothetical protein
LKQKDTVRFWCWSSLVSPGTRHEHDTWARSFAVNGSTGAHCSLCKQGVQARWLVPVMLHALKPELGAPGHSPAYCAAG